MIRPGNEADVVTKIANFIGCQMKKAKADKAVVGLARQLQKSEEALAGYAEAATCHLGDFMEYARLRRRISDLEKDAARGRRR